MEIEKLIELNKKLGIELISIDVTKYICDTIKQMLQDNFTTFPNRQFSFEHEGQIGFQGSGIWNAIGEPLVTNVDFFHDLHYYNGIELMPTKCVFDSLEVEKCINENICNNLT